MLARVCDFAELHTIKGKNGSFYGKANSLAKIMPKGKNLLLIVFNKQQKSADNRFIGALLRFYSIKAFPRK